MPESYDMVVVGGGPGGSTVASLVAKQGRRVLLLEKEFFPRYQIGESLLPATVLGVCKILGIEQKLEDAKFVVKRGGTLKWGAKPDLWEFRFTDAFPRAEREAFAYQVERMKFDQLLLDHAKECGVEVREGCSVSDVVSDDERVRGLRYTDADGNEQSVQAQFVVDASGNKSRIYRHVAAERQYSEFFRNLAIFGYFENGKRLPPPNSGNVITAAFPSGWFWYIPLSDTLTSVGAVVRHDLAEKVQGDREQAYRDLIAESPLISEYLADATRVTEGTYGEIRIRKDYSYCGTSFARPGMLLVGDAACFIDPVLSTGVHLATYSALLAARSINSVLAGTVDEQTALAEFERRYLREYGTFHEFLVSFYDTHVDRESYFWKAKKVTNYPKSEMEAFASLLGGAANEQIVTEETLRTGNMGEALVSAVHATAVDHAEAADIEPSAATDSDAEQALRFDPNEAPWGTARWLPENVGKALDSDTPVLVPSADALHWEVKA